MTFFKNENNNLDKTNMEREKYNNIPYLDETNIGILYFYQIKEKRTDIKK